MSTKHTSFIPMSPVQRPQQRLNEVVSIPTLLKGFNPKLEYSEPLLKQRPKGSPRKLTHLFSVEWAWSPMHNRIDNYYLNPRRTDFLLWNNCLNDHTVPWTWSWELLAYGNRCKADEKAIAAHLVKALWECEAEHGTDHYHWINNTGLLSTEEVQALAREVC